MPSLTRRPSSSQKSSGRDSRGSRRSKDSYDSQSTAATSISSSPGSSHGKASRSSSSSESYTSAASRPKYQQGHDYGGVEVDVGHGTSLYPRASVDTYASSTASERDMDAAETDKSISYDDNNIPVLPLYTRDVIEPNVRPSSPQDFARLFPSLNRLSIRHDEYTSDGNMNLRIDTVVTGRRRTAIQLFHLRMYDLAKREFSLRRYCRDSGREVCNSKRLYTEPAVAKVSKTEKHEKEDKREESSRPSLQRSMSSAIKSLGGGNTKQPAIRRTTSGNSFFSSKSSSSKSSKSSSSSKRQDAKASYCLGEGNVEYVVDADSRESLASSRSGSDTKQQKQQKAEASNTIKLEFSNYARVDVHRRGSSKSKRYEFDWWGHRYAWKRSIDKDLGLVSFHLTRDGHTEAAVAHIVPESRSPSQIYADESAGGWVPPCFMWIEDESVLDAVTDVADVIMATGLVALVDDCIKERWQPNKVHHIPVPLTTKTVDVAPKSFMQQLFGRRDSKKKHQKASKPFTPLQYARPMYAC